MTLILVVVVVGAANYAFRYLPLGLAANRVQHVGGRLGAALQALGSGAIAALCYFAVSDFFPHAWLPAIIGLSAVALTMWRTQNVAAATLIGAALYAIARLF